MEIFFKFLWAFSKYLNFTNAEVLGMHVFEYISTFRLAMTSLVSRMTILNWTNFKCLSEQWVRVEEPNLLSIKCKIYLSIAELLMFTTITYMAMIHGIEFGEERNMLVSDYPFYPNYLGMLKWDFSFSAVTINHIPKISHPYFHWYSYQNTSVCMH